MSPLEQRLRSLLRWYPRAWRERHGDVMLATLLDDAEARGSTRPTRADAWSIRMHGAAERATPRAAAIVAGVGVLLAALSAASQSFAFTITTTPARERIVDIEWLRPAWVGVGGGLAPLLIVVAALMLVSWRRVAAPAFATGALTAAVAWGVLNGAALWTFVDPVVTVTPGGGTSTSMGMPSVAVHAATVAILAVGLTPLARAALPVPRRHPIAWVLAAGCALGIAVLGVALSQTGLMPFAGIVLVLAGAVRSRPRGRRDPNAAVPPPWSTIVVGGLAGVALVLAVPTATLLMAARFDLVAADGAGMRVAAAMLVASTIPIVVAAALVARPRLGAPAWVPAALVAAATIVAAAAVLPDPGRPIVEPLVAVGAVLAGVGVAVAVAVAAPGHPAVRTLVAVLVGAGTAVLLVTALPFVLSCAWLAAIPLLAVAVARHRSVSRAAQPEEAAAPA